MKIMVMGAGDKRPGASILSRVDDISAIKLCDINEGILEKVKKKIASPKLEVAKVDASDIDSIAAAARGMDAVIDLVTHHFLQML